MKGFKTIVFGALMAVISLLSGESEFAKFVGEHWQGFGAVSGGVIIFLRYLTTSAIFKS